MCSLLSRGEPLVDLFRSSTSNIAAMPCTCAFVSPNLFVAVQSPTRLFVPVLVQGTQISIRFTSVKCCTFGFVRLLLVFPPQCPMQFFTVAYIFHQRLPNPHVFQQNARTSATGLKWVQAFSQPLSFSGCSFLELSEHVVAFHVWFWGGS